MAVCKNLLGVLAVLCLVQASRQDAPFTGLNGCSSNCQVCNTSLSACHQCGSQLYFKADDFKCVRVDNTILGCDLYVTAGICVKCRDQFALDKGQCLGCTARNCLKCSVNVNVCLECLPGFSKASATASDCDQRCLVTNCRACGFGSETTCQQCSPGYRLTAT